MLIDSTLLIGNLIVDYKYMLCEFVNIMDVFYKGIANHVEIKKILKEYEVKYDKEKDIEFFDELITGILEDHPAVSNLDIVLERILIYIVNRDLKL